MMDAPNTTSDNRVASSSARKGVCKSRGVYGLSPTSSEAICSTCDVSSIAAASSANW